MTEKEVSRFALQLSEAERIRAMIASEEGALAHGGSDEPSRGAVSVGEHYSAPVVATTA
jgi:hypothetical protein